MGRIFLALWLIVAFVAIAHAQTLTVSDDKKEAVEVTMKKVSYYQMKKDIDRLEKKLNELKAIFSQMVEPVVVPFDPNKLEGGV